VDRLNIFLLLFLGSDGLRASGDANRVLAEVEVFEACLACFRLAFRVRAARSLGSSLVENAEQVISQKRRSSQPSTSVAESISVRVDSVCIWSLANACHSASQNNRVITILLCGSGRSPSKTAIAHYGFGM